MYVCECVCVSVYLPLSIQYHVFSCHISVVSFNLELFLRFVFSDPDTFEAYRPVTLVLEYPVILIFWWYLMIILRLFFFLFSAELWNNVVSSEHHTRRHRGTQCLFIPISVINVDHVIKLVFSKFLDCKVNNFTFVIKK